MEKGCSARKYYRKASMPPKSTTTLRPCIAKISFYVFLEERLLTGKLQVQYSRTLLSSALSVLQAMES